MKQLSKVKRWLVAGLLAAGMAFAAERVAVVEMITDET
jgi:hypothetical protein